MRSSIKRRLLTYVALVTALTAIPAFALSLLFSYQEAKSFQDKTLQQLGDLNVVDARLHHQVSHDKSYQLSVFLLSDPDLPPWLSPELSLGFHTLEADGQHMRLWVGQQGNERFVVMQPTSQRDVLVLDSALSAILPLLVLLPLLSGLIWLGVSKELASMTQLAKAMDDWVEPMPQSLQIAAVPTELRGFVVAMNHLLARWHQLFVRQQRFSADAAHELRTPLAALSLQVQNLAQAQEAHEWQQRIEPVMQGVARCQRLATQLLDFNRLQSQTYPKQTIELHDLLLELLSLYWAAAEAKEQTLVLDMPDSTLLVCSHAEALQLIFGNGLDNAIKYAPVGSEILLTVTQSNSDWLVCIVDEGVDVVQDKLNSLFEPFLRAHAGEVVGNGLGLSIAASAAEQLGAKLSLLRRLDGSSGLCFCLTHPS